jgi:hypothetical protein
MDNKMIFPKKYIIINPSCNKVCISHSIWGISNGSSFKDIDDNVSPYIFNTVGSAKSCITSALKEYKRRFRNSNMSGHLVELFDLPSFAIGLQIIEIDLSIGKTKFEYVFNIDKIIKPTE